jgi:hypothetical protein
MAPHWPVHRMGEDLGSAGAHALVHPVVDVGALPALRRQLQALRGQLLARVPRRLFERRLNAGLLRRAFARLHGFLIATVTNQGKTRWMIIDEAFDADKLIEFLQALIKDAGKKVFLILDNLRVHHSKLVKAWVAEHQDQIELFYLPSYSPQLNPEERLNADLKQEIGKRVPVRTKAKLREAANDHMAMLEQNPERVIGYFQDRYVRYAA